MQWIDLLWLILISTVYPPTCCLSDCSLYPAIFTSHLIITGHVARPFAYFGKCFIFFIQTNSPRFFWPSSLLGFTQLTWNVWFSLNKRVDYFITSFNVLHRPETDFRWRHKKLEMSSTFKFMYQEDPLNRAAGIS